MMCFHFIRQVRRSRGRLGWDRAITAISTATYSTIDTIPDGNIKQVLQLKVLSSCHMTAAATIVLVPYSRNVHFPM